MLQGAQSNMTLLDAFQAERAGVYGRYVEVKRELDGIDAAISVLRGKSVARVNAKSPVCDRILDILDHGPMKACDIARALWPNLTANGGAWNYLRKMVADGSIVRDGYLYRLPYGGSNA
jgi:hypothetical protein